MLNEIVQNIRNKIVYYKRRPYRQVYIGEAPIDVDDCVWIRPASGVSKVHFDKETYDHSKYLIYVRNGNNSNAIATIVWVYAALNNVVGDAYVILTDSLPRFVGRDEKNRAIYSFRVEYQLGGY